MNLEEFGLKEEDLKAVQRIFIIACGTSYHAAMIGKYMIERLAKVPVEIDIASEFRYRRPLLGSGDLMIVITQSGETADTLAAQREAKRLGARVLSICNVVGSTSSREADSVFYTHSGPEIGVASTKAFTTQIVGLYLFAVGIGYAKGAVSAEMSRELLTELLMLPGKAEEALIADENIKMVAKEFFKSRDFLYLGRGINYPVALEGALKLKEISYIHAEGYAAGEMKHGPIALIDEEMPVVTWSGATSVASLVSVILKSGVPGQQIFTTLPPKALLVMSTLGPSTAGKNKVPPRVLHSAPIVSVFPGAPGVYSTHSAIPSPALAKLSS